MENESNGLKPIGMPIGMPIGGAHWNARWMDPLDGPIGEAQWRARWRAYNNMFPLQGVSTSCSLKRSVIFKMMMLSDGRGSFIISHCIDSA